MELTYGETPITSVWYEDDRYVGLFDVPGTLSGDIRLNRDLPSLPGGGHFEIEGDVIRPLETCPSPPRTPRRRLGRHQRPPCEETQIPLRNHQSPPPLRRPVPRHPLLPAPRPPPRRFRDRRPRFRKRETRGYILGHFSTLATYNRWLLHLRVDNLLFGEDGERLVVCDLEERWGQRVAPEVAWEGSPEESGWSERSDVYGVGACIKGMVYMNAPITPKVEWPVPEPLRQVVEVCMRKLPEARPTVGELGEMVEAIKVA